MKKKVVSHSTLTSTKAEMKLRKYGWPWFIPDNMDQFQVSVNSLSDASNPLISVALFCDHLFVLRRTIQVGRRKAKPIKLSRSKCVYIKCYIKRYVPVDVPVLSYEICIFIRLKLIFMCAISWKRRIAPWFGDSWDPLFTLRRILFSYLSHLLELVYWRQIQHNVLAGNCKWVYLR